LPKKDLLPMLPRLNDALDFQSQALVLRAERQRVIAGNIANADTPGFKARDFDFASNLRAATAAAGGGNSGNGNSGGIAQGVASSVMSSTGRFTPELGYSVPNQTHLDNNTVDMDRERGAFVDNAVKYEATLRFINGSVRSMLDAMKSHNQ
jgi:flagellar basal-body rod protein FlgB